MSITYKPYKKEEEHSYAFGVFPTIELLQQQPDQVRKVILHRDGLKNAGVTLIQELCLTLGIDVEMNDKQIARLGAKENCYAVGIFTKAEQKLASDRSHVLMVNPGDMGNLGTIIRTMTGFGLTDMAIIRPGVDAFDPKVIRASMGSLFRTRIQYFTDYQEYEEAYPRRHAYPFMLNAKKKLQEVQVSEDSLYTLVFGNESSGLPDEYLDRGTSVIIPHTADIDSLNLSIAVGIALYHFTKDRFV